MTPCQVGAKHLHFCGKVLVARAALWYTPDQLRFYFIPASGGRINMEIEAKFKVPNRQAYRELLRVRSLGRYAVAPATRIQVVDRYFDAPDSRLLASGYSCRLRSEGERIIATLKGLGGVEGGVHRRDEQEIDLPELLLRPADWPASPARELALELAAGAALEPLFDLQQTRQKCDVLDGERRVAELSLDEVRAVVGQRPAFYYEVEVELRPDGTEEDLALLAATLRDEYGLEAESRSKFARGLETLRERGTAIHDGLTAAERATLEAYAAGSDEELARRAATILGWADGLPTREIVAATGLSSGRVRFWVRTFRGQRMDIFAPGADTEPDEAVRRPAPQPPAPKRQEPERAAPARPRRATATSTQRQAPAGPVAPRGPQPPAVTPPARAAATAGVEAEPAAAPRGFPSVPDFCRRHGVDLERSRYAADMALELFDALRKVHRMPRRRRRLLRQAALLATVGAQADPEHPFLAGRDLILAQPLRNVNTNERLALACIVALQRKKMKPEKEHTLDALEPKLRSHALLLAALLQIGWSFTFDGPNSTAIRMIEGGDSAECAVILEGPPAEADAQQAAVRAEYWRQFTKQQLVFLALVQPVAAAASPAHAAPAQPVPEEPPLPADLPALLPEDSMSEAGRKVILTHFVRMLANEAGTREGADIEFLHDMRVSTRRMRAAYRIFEPYYDAEAVKRFNKNLRRAGGTLGAVRDLDVLIEKAEAYQAGLPQEDDLTVEPLLASWHGSREVARRELIEYLDSSAYRDFVAAFRVFLLTPGAQAKPIPEGEPVAHQLRHVVPRLVMERYEQVRAYEPILATAPITTYHQLRVDFKRLRYALEFFQKQLGPEASGIIKQVTALQDLLGALQDAHVAEELIRAFLDEQRGKRKKALPLAGVEQYWRVQQITQQELLARFPAPWAEVLGVDFRRSLALALAAL